MSRVQATWIVIGALVVLGCVCLSVYPLLALHPSLRSFLVVLGLELSVIPVLALFVFGRTWGLWEKKSKGQRADITIIKNAILAFTCFGMIAIVLFALSSPAEFSWSNVLRIGGIGLLYAGSCFAFGALLGFLFGIPRSVASGGRKNGQDTTPGHEPEDAGTGRRARYTANTNLEEISDWLTKIIVGLGLINLKFLPGQLKASAWYFSNFCGTAYCESVALAIIIYFSVCGFFLGYLLTRIYLPGAFSRSDQEAEEGGRVDSLPPGPPPGLKALSQKGAVTARSSGTIDVDLGVFDKDSLQEAS